MKLEPFTKSAIGGNDSLMFAYHRAIVAAAAIGGEVYFASYGDTETIVGVAAWFPPGHVLLDTSVSLTFSVQICSL